MLQFNFRHNEADRGKLDSLGAEYGSKSKAVAVALDRLYRDHQRETFRLAIQWLENLYDQGWAIVDILDDARPEGVSLEDLKRWV